MMNNSQGASSFFSGLSTLLGRPHPLLHNLSDTTLEEGLIREDDKILYPVREDIPIMLIDEAIELDKLA